MESKQAHPWPQVQTPIYERSRNHARFGSLLKRLAANHSDDASRRCTEMK